MQYRSPLRSVAFFIALGLPLTACGDRGARSHAFTSAEVDTALGEIRTLANHRAWEKGIDLGREWAEMAPGERELRAWYVYHLSRANRAEDAIAEAEAMAAGAPDDPWTLFALARALNGSEDRGDEALALSERAYETRPDDVYFARLRADVLRDQIDQRASLEFIATLPPELRGTAEILHRKGVALYQLATGDDSAGVTVEEAWEAFAAARAADPNDVESRFLPGAYLISARRLEEGMALVEEAVDLAPESPDLHRYYWRAVVGLPDLTPEEKRERVMADIERLMAVDPEAPAALSAAASQFGELDMPERRKELEERLLAVAPNSLEAEWVYVNRYRDIRREMYELNREKAAAEESGDEARVSEIETEVADLREALRAQLATFIVRDSHVRETLLGDAYREMFYVLRDDLEDGREVAPDYLLEVVNGMAEHEGINTHITHAMAPIVLAEETDHDARALELVREGFGRMTEGAFESRDFYDSEGEFDEAARRRLGIMYDALGWVHYQMGREDAAEHVLIKASQIRKDQRDALYHLGRLYEDRYDRAASDAELDDPAVRDEYYALAEEHYIRGVAVQGMGENPNDAALEALYEKRYGSLDGFEVYIADVEERDRQRRMKTVLDARLEEPRGLPAFELATLSGEDWSSTDLAGRVAVVNFWGVWCGPCVAEMPDIQAFHARYEGDPDVVFFTINNDQNPDKAREYMAEEGFTFPVLIDDGYLNDASMHTFPTTWFIGRDGAIHYVKEGWSEALVEEFSWRVEDLKDDVAGPPSEVVAAVRGSAG